jgi:hypothetical protein
VEATRTPYTTYNLAICGTLFLTIILLSSNSSAGFWVMTGSSISFFAIVFSFGALCMPRVYQYLSDLAASRNLPLHAALLRGTAPEKILAMLGDEAVAESAGKRDREGRTAFTIALEVDVRDVEVMSELLERSLPFDDITEQPIEPGMHDYAWTRIVQRDRYAGVVRTILFKHPHLSALLSETVDLDGRAAVNIAAPECRRIIMQQLYFYRRYDITTLERPLHQTQNCIGMRVNSAAEMIAS